MAPVAPQPVTNLVFAGGGVRGSAYVGAVEALDAAGHLGSVKRVAGASAGSIVAGLLAVGADAQRLRRCFDSLHFPDMIKDSGWIFGDLYRLLTGYGLHSGAPMRDWLRLSIGTLTSASLGVASPDITFRQLESARLAGRPVRRLYAVSSDLTAQIPRLLSYETTPDLAIWMALRMSASLPVVFQPVLHDGHLYVDGGVSWNYPVDLFDGDYDLRALGAPPLPDEPGRTIGFALGTKADITDLPRTVRISSIEDAVRAFVSFLLEESTRLHTSKEALARTVILPDLGLSPADFSITVAQEQALIKLGHERTEAWLRAHEAGQVPVESSTLDGSR